MNIPAPIQKVMDKTQELKQEIKNVGTESIKEFLTELFAAHEQVQAVRWVQYTPHFNDGDPCTFSVNSPEVRLTDGLLISKGVPGRGWGEQDEHSDGNYVSGWEIHKEQPVLSKAINEIERVFGDIEDVMLAVFGDGVQVTVTRDGEVEIEDYDHD